MKIQIIFSQMMMLFVMMLIGYVIWKKKWLDENAYQKLSRIVVNILNPFLAIYGVAGKSSEGNEGLLLQNLMLVIVYFAVLWGMSFLMPLLLRPARRETYEYRMMTMFASAASIVDSGSIGFMAVPVITAIYGNEAMIYIVFYMLGFNFLIYTYGIHLAGKAGELAKEERGRAGKAVFGLSGIRKILNSGVIASLIAVAVFVFQIPLPDVAVRFCDYMGNATIPLSMLLIGASIAKVNLRTILTNGRIYLFTILRMVLLPIALLFVVRALVPVDPVILGVFILQTATPVGSIVVLMSKENGADETCCTNGTVLTTLLSLLTIPLVCCFL